MLYSMGGGSRRAEGDLAPLGLSTAITCMGEPPRPGRGTPAREPPTQEDFDQLSTIAVQCLDYSSFCMDATTIIQQLTVGGISSKHQRTWAQTRRVVKVC